MLSHLPTQEFMVKILGLLEMKHYLKDKRNCLKNKKRNTQSGCKGHLSIKLKLKTHYVFKGKLDSLKLIKITEHLDSQLILVGNHFKIQFNKKSIRMS